MKHGRRHKTLKEQAYIARKDAEGYGRPYRPIDVAEPSGEFAHEAPPEEIPLAAKLSTKEKKRLRFAGVDPDAPE
jgi:hypothetical protein